MRNEFTSIIERDFEWYIACCPEIPGANGQGRTKGRSPRESIRGDCADFGGQTRGGIDWFGQQKSDRFPDTESG